VLSIESDGVSAESEEFLGAEVCLHFVVEGCSRGWHGVELGGGSWARQSHVSFGPGIVVCDGGVGHIVVSNGCIDFGMVDSDWSGITNSSSRSACRWSIGC